MIQFIIEQGEGALWGRIDHGHFVATTSAATVAEVTKNIREQIADYLANEGKDDAAWSGATADSIELVPAYDLQAFFAAHPELKITAIAELAGMNASLVRQYSAGVKYPSREQANRIQNAIHQLGRELSKVTLFVVA